jgi:O-antigen ligase
MFRVLSPVGLLNLGTSDLVLPVVVGVLLVRVVVEREPGERPVLLVPGAVPLAVAAVVVLTGSLTVWSVADPDFLVSRAVSDTAKLCIGVGYFGLVVVLVRRGGQLAAYRSIRLWTWVATGLAAASVLGAVLGTHLVPDDGYGSRSVGFFADPNLYAGYLLLSLALVVFRATVLPTPLLVLQTVVLVAGLVATGSRGGLATLALLAVFSAFMISSARVRAGVIALAVGGAAVAWTLLPEHPGSGSLLGVDRLLVSSAESGDDARFELWQLALRLWFEHPFLGIGMGQYPRFSVGIVGEMETSELGHVVHNSFLSVLVSLGVVGFAIFLAYFGWLLHTLYAARSLTRSQRHALAGGVLVVVAQMMTLNLENLPYVWIYFGLVVGIAVAERVPAARPPRELVQTSRGRGLYRPVTRRPLDR